MCTCPVAALLNEMNSLKQETREQNLQLQHRLTQTLQRLQERESAMEEMEKEQQRQAEELRRQVEDLRLQLENTERQLKSNKHFLDVSLLVIGFLLRGVFCLLVSTCRESSPSKHAGSDSHNNPDRIRLEKLASSGPDDSFTLACFQTGSIWPIPGTVNQNQIGPGLVLNSMSQVVWKNATESESVKLVAGWLRSPRTGPDDFCTLAYFQTRSVWPKPDQAIQVGSRLI